MACIFAWIKILVKKSGFCRSSYKAKGFDQPLNKTEKLKKNWPMIFYFTIISFPISCCAFLKQFLCKKKKRLVYFPLYKKKVCKEVINYHRKLKKKKTFDMSCEPFFFNIYMYKFITAKETIMYRYKL